MNDKALKHGLGSAAIERIASAFSQVAPAFAADVFRQQCLDGLETLALKQRVQHIIAALAMQLPARFAEAAPLLMAVKQHWDYGRADDPTRAFAAWPVIDYVAVYGIDQPHIALPVLHWLTSLFSAEFAIQPFILRHFDYTYPQLVQWCNDSDPHVRRLVSEGMRPRLPWGLRMQQFCRDPSPILPLLEKLKSDDSAYVRKSVANNLNDISKTHPQLVLDLCRQWQPQASEHTGWIIRHATRGLVKQGHPAVFPLLDYPTNPTITITEMTLTPASIAIGDTMTFHITLHNHGQQPQAIVLDYALHYLTATGKQSRKVFKLTTCALAPGESRSISKQHAFKPLATRSHHPGLHIISVLINGHEKARAEFALR